MKELVRRPPGTAFRERQRAARHALNAPLPESPLPPVIVVKVKPPKVYVHAPRRSGGTFMGVG